MEQAIVKQLDKNLKCSESIIKNEKILLKIYSTKGSIRCPDCEQKSTKVHSGYQREFQDIPIQVKAEGKRYIWEKNIVNNCKYPNNWVAILLYLGN